MEMRIPGRQRQYLDATHPGAVCEVHGILLQEGEVSVAYGLRRGPSQEQIEARNSRFPHANSFYPGNGCVVKEPTLAGVSFCPKCREAEAAWQDRETLDSTHSP